MIDIITVVFDQELPVLQAQAQSIERYCQDVGNIYVVINDNNVIATQVNPAWWNTLSDRVVIVPRSTFNTNYSDNGWLSQQALKLMTAAISYNEWSLILDAKTVFVKPLDKLFDAQGRACVGQLDIYPVFDRSRQIVNDLFNIDLPHQLGPGGVPFVVNNSTARALIAEVERITKTSFPKWFQAQGMLTEFILYSGYVYLHGGFESMYNINTNIVDPVNICHSEVAAFDRKFATMQTASTVSIHRNAWSELSAVQQQQYIDFLDSRGIKL